VATHSIPQESPHADHTPERFALLLRMLQDLSGDTDPVRSINRYAKELRLLEMNQGLISISLRGVPEGHYKIMRILHQEGVDYEGVADLFYAGDTAKVAAGGLIGDIIREPRVLVYGDLACVDDAGLGNQLAPYRSLVAFPIFSGGEVWNWMCFLNMAPNYFTQEGIEYRILQANLMGGLTDVKRAHQSLQVATEYIERQVDEIASIQRGMLPPKLPEVPGLQLAATYATYDRAGGDFYDIFPLRELSGAGCPNDPRWAFVIADASGHGPSAAVVIAMLTALLHAYPKKPEAPSEMLAHLNHYLLRKPINHSFITAFMGFYDPRDQSVTCAGAGHPMPLIRRSCGSVESLPAMDGIPLGILEEAHYADAGTRLDTNQCLLLYTDGVTEARPGSHDMFGEDRLVEALGACLGSPQETLDVIEARLREHEAGQRQEDDQTMLALQAT
jgi:sigma-B regulation protein RsbU (phosphoserine phosphatase)